MKSSIEIKSNLEFLVRARTTPGATDDIWYLSLVDFGIYFWRKALQRSKKTRTVRKDASFDLKIRVAKEYPLAKLIPSRNGMAHCPFHKDKTASFDIRRNFYHCYGCGESGDVISFVMKTQNKTFREAVETLSTIHT